MPPLLNRASLALFLATALPASAAESVPPVNYSRDIRPLFSNSCYACHGPDAGQRKAKLRLDVRDEAVKKVIVQGKASESIIIERLTTTEPDDHMPPADSKKPALTPGQVELVRRWIDQGAKFDQHWAYVKPNRPAVPETRNPKSQIRNQIDAFVLARLEKEGLKPAVQADRITLIRRLSFDLIGLPPTPEEVDAFINDTSTNAYEKLVERLLASKHFGERMAVYWLDLVRYADTGGYHSDNHRDVALYRDYVIDAFNANKPFDRFTIEQIAGDLLPNATNEQKIASGYNRLLQTTEEGGAQAKEYTAKYAADRVRNASSVWMAATLGCGECHDHKFDPYRTRDFYRFEAFFADVQEKAVGRQDQTPILDSPQAAKLKAFDEQIAHLRRDPTKPALSGAVIQARKDTFLKTAATTLVAMSGPPRTVRVLPRGNWLDDSGEVVTPDVPAFLGSVTPEKGRATRMDLAKWVVAPDNPLTARVFVNRLWKIAFGQGIVRTLDDFGTQGAWPTHPELLDWLATEFIRTGWDVKGMLKLLVMSNAYRMSSVPPNDAREKDPGNLWLARQNRFRLDAEFVRDNALAVSGLLVTKVGGASVKPYQPGGYWAYLNFPKREWDNAKGPDQYRRGLYTYWCRSFLHPSLAAFDAPTREECSVERPRSSTPLQALVLLNDPTYVEAARVFAEKAIEQAGASGEDRLNWMYRRALSRPAKSEELTLLDGLLRKHLAEYQADPAAAKKLLAAGDTPAAKDIDVTELAAWTSVARVILNLHETITRN
jgi:mono/diheme cytochrome c family protein